MADEPEKPASAVDPTAAEKPADPSPAPVPAVSADAAAKPAAAAAPKAAVPAAKPAAPAAAKPADGAAKPAAAKAAPHPPAAPAPPSGPTEPPPPADKPVPVFIATLQAAVPNSVSLVSYYVGDWTIVVPLELMTQALRHLRDAPDAAFDFCSDVTATDWPPRKEARFDLLYCLYSTRLRHRIRVKVRVGESTPVPSVTELWPAANWLEREVYDMSIQSLASRPCRISSAVP